MDRYKRYFKEADALPMRGILRIKDPTLYTIADRLLILGTLNPTTNFKIIKKLNDNKLLQLLTKKTGKEFQISMGVKDFSLQDIINFDKKIREFDNKPKPEGDSTTQFSYPEYSIFNDPQVLKHIHKDLSTWTGAQRFITNLDNHVLQFNIDKQWLEDYFYEREHVKQDMEFPLYGNNWDNINGYIKNSNHPTSRAKLTLGWCRFTLLKPGAIIAGNWVSLDKWNEVKNSNEDERRSSDNMGTFTEKSVILDEIQTDINDDKFLGESLMRGWQEYMMRMFVYFIRGSLKVRKIYMPSYETKQNLYNANPPMSLYKELPNKFGFKKDSDIKGFMLLENLKRK